MKTLVTILLAILCSAVTSAAEPVNWREIWDGDKRDWWNKSIPELRKLVEQKNPFATLILADKLIDTDRDEAVKLRQQAVDYGLPQAMVWLAEAPGTPYAQRVSLITRAAELGYPKAQVDAAVCYFHENVHPDYDKALAALRVAADYGDKEGMKELAGLYAAGIGEPRNEKEKPINLLRALAAKGEESVEQDLERRLRQGIGTEIDLLEAAFYYYRDKARRLVSQTANATFVAQRYNLRQDPAAMLALYRQSDIRRDPNRETVELLDTLFDDALTRRDTAALTELAKLHENGTYGKPNLARACALLTFANSPAAAEKTKLLTSDQMQAMQRDLRWMRELPVRK
jgi:TPR repeat protein